MRVLTCLHNSSLFSNPPDVTIKANPTVVYNEFKNDFMGRREFGFGGM